VANAIAKAETERQRNWTVHCGRCVSCAMKAEGECVGALLRRAEVGTPDTDAALERSSC